MRLSDFSDWFALRRHLTHPWAFLRLRKKPPAEPFYEIAFRNGGTFRIRTRPGDRHTFHRLWARDEYRLKGLAPGSLGTVVDIGAHIGTFAVRAASLARRVLCYEPAPENLELLRRNVAPYPNVVVHPLAVAGRRGPVRLYLRENPAAHSLWAGESGPSLTPSPSKASLWRTFSANTPSSAAIFSSSIAKERNMKFSTPPLRSCGAGSRVWRWSIIRSETRTPADPERRWPGIWTDWGTGRNFALRNTTPARGSSSLNAGISNIRGAP